MKLALSEIEDEMCVEYEESQYSSHETEQELEDW